MPRALWIFSALSLLASSLQALTPGEINVNGHLSDADDRPLEGTHALLFRLYDQAEEGEPFFSESLVLSFTAAPSSPPSERRSPSISASSAPIAPASGWGSRWASPQS